MRVDFYTGSKNGFNTIQGVYNGFLEKRGIYITVYVIYTVYIVYFITANLKSAFRGPSIITTGIQ